MRVYQATDSRVVPARLTEQPQVKESEAFILVPEKHCHQSALELPSVQKREEFQAPPGTRHQHLLPNPCLFCLLYTTLQTRFPVSRKPDRPAQCIGKSVELNLLAGQHQFLNFNLAPHPHLYATQLPLDTMRGNDQQVKVHFKGAEDDFIIFVDSAKAVSDWKADKSVPLAQVVSGWKIFVTHKQGTQGILDGASKGSLESEFGTSKDDDVVAQILEKGQIIETECKLATPVLHTARSHLAASLSRNGCTTQPGSIANIHDVHDMVTSIVLSQHVHIPSTIPFTNTLIAIKLPLISWAIHLCDLVISTSPLSSIATGALKVHIRGSGLQTRESLVVTRCQSFDGIAWQRNGLPRASCACGSIAQDTEDPLML
ncbi:hypothetical protein MRB53_042077 [Persea americana]|nr:hypothetical protein MRB53_042077 [Persea americana]